MQRLAELVLKLEEGNRELARVGCQMTDRLLRGITPRILNEEQLHRRQTLLWVEKRLRNLYERRRNRGRRVKARLRRAPDLGRLWNEHRQLLEDQEGILETRKSILRQLGDVIAWLVLRSDPYLLAALSAPRTHHLPSEVGLVGPIMVMNTAHASGKFLVIDNDLTRCLGVGDITVVRADGRWIRPLPIEIKTSGKFELGAELDLELITAVSDDPVDAELFREFRAVLNLRDEPEKKRPLRKHESQSEEILQHSQFLAEVTRRMREQPTPKNFLWQGMSRVLSRALEEGSAFELLDEGIFGVAIRLWPESSHESELRRILAELQKLGFGGDRPELISANTSQFKEQDAISAYVPPIPLWDLPVELRSALLSGGLFYGCVYDPAVWERAMAAEGISLTRERKDDLEQWVLQKGEQIGRFDPIETRKATWGVLFGGVKPREIAAVISESFSALAAKARDGVTDHSTNSTEAGAQETS